MPELPSHCFADIPQPWRLTHPQLRRAAIARLGCDAENRNAVLQLLDRVLEVLNTSPEPPLPEPILTYWEFTAAWLAEAMPEMAGVSEQAVAALLEQKGLGSPVSAAELTEYFSWWVVADLVRSLLAWLRDMPAACRSTIDAAHFLKLAERRWRGLQPYLAGELFRAAVEVLGAGARPLLEAVGNDPAVPEPVRAAAGNYASWIDLPT